MSCVLDGAENESWIKGMAVYNNQLPVLGMNRQQAMDNGYLPIWWNNVQGTIVATWIDKQGCGEQ